MAPRARGDEKGSCASDVVNQDSGQTIVQSSIVDVEFGESAVTPVTLDT